MFYLLRCIPGSIGLQCCWRKGTGQITPSSRPVVTRRVAVAAPAPTGIVMESWVRAVVEAIHSSRSQTVIYLAGGASQVSVPTPPTPTRVM
jgi:hypothetical protein